MSLESQIAELITVNNKLVEYFNTKKAAIDAAVSAAVAAAPAITRILYVDSQLGSDDNLGTSASPFKTLQKAVDVTPSGGRCEIWLQKDYTLSGHVRLYGRQVMLRAEEGSGRKLILNEYTPDTETLPRVGCFWQSSASTLEFANLTISFPNSSPAVSNYCALSIASGSTAPLIMSLRLWNCVLELRGTYRGRLIGPESMLIMLGVTSTAIPSALAGQIMPGVAAGTDAKTLPHVVTNVPTL